MEKQQESIITQGATFDQLLSRLRQENESLLTRFLDKLGKANHSDDILTLPEAAEFLRKSHATIYRYTSKRCIPHFRKGGSLYFSKRELDAWLKTGKKILVENI